MRTVETIRLTPGLTQPLFLRTVTRLLRADSSAALHGCHLGPRLTGSASGTAFGARIWADRARWQHGRLLCRDPGPFCGHQSPISEAGRRQHSRWCTTSDRRAKTMNNPQFVRNLGWRSATSRASNASTVSARSGPAECRGLTFRHRKSLALCTANCDHVVFARGADARTRGDAANSRLGRSAIVVSPIAWEKSPHTAGRAVTK
jgi:hypothetical protein